MGHEFEVREFPSEQEALQFEKDLEKANTTEVGQGHKQGYWIEKKT